MHCLPRFPGGGVTLDDFFSAANATFGVFTTSIAIAAAEEGQWWRRGEFGCGPGVRKLELPLPRGGYRQDISVVPATGAAGATGAVFPTGRSETLPEPPTRTSDITMTALKRWTAASRQPRGKTEY